MKIFDPVSISRLLECTTVILAFGGISYMMDRIMDCFSILASLGSPHTFFREWIGWSVYRLLDLSCIGPVISSMILGIPNAVRDTVFHGAVVASFFYLLEDIPQLLKAEWYDSFFRNPRWPWSQRPHESVKAVVEQVAKWMTPESSPVKITRRRLSQDEAIGTVGAEVVRAVSGELDAPAPSGRSRKKPTTPSSSVKTRRAKRMELFSGEK